MSDLDDLHTGGSADFATVPELERDGWTKPGGIYLGYEGDTFKAIYWNGEGHVLTVAPSGFGKTSKLIIPNLLSYERGSVIVTDPKGSLAAVTARYRREAFGNRIVMLNPWQEEIADPETGLGVDLGSTGFNPLRMLKPGDPGVIDNAELLAKMICPTPPGSRDAFFTKAAAQILTGCLLYLCHAENQDCTLPALFLLTRRSPQGWKELADDMAALEGVTLRPYAAEILQNIDADRQWAGIVGAINEATQIYNPAKTLGAHVAKDEFDPDDLKREKVTVYIVIPSNRRQANQAWLGLVVSVLAEAVGKPSKSAPVLLVAEEFANLGFMPTIGNAMAEYREAGLKVHLVIQNINQLAKIYGPDGAHDLINNCNVEQYFGIKDKMLADRISTALGQYTLHEYTKPGGLFNFSEVGLLVGRHTQPLMRASDLLNLPNDEQIIFSAGQTPPIKGKLVGYWENARLAGRADPNPYRDRDATAENGEPGTAKRKLPGLFLASVGKGIGSLWRARLTKTGKAIGFWGPPVIGFYIGGGVGIALGFVISFAFSFTLPKINTRASRIYIRK
jgi:type IV secretion system protein VirD4